MYKRVLTWFVLKGLCGEKKVIKGYTHCAIASMSSYVERTIGNGAHGLGKCIVKEQHLTGLATEVGKTGLALDALEESIVHVTCHLKHLVVYLSTLYPRAPVIVSGV